MEISRVLWLGQYRISGSRNCITRGISAHKKLVYHVRNHFEKALALSHVTSRQLANSYRLNTKSKACKISHLRRTDMIVTVAVFDQLKTPLAHELTYTRRHLSFDACVSVNLWHSSFDENII